MYVCMCDSDKWRHCMKSLAPSHASIYWNFTHFHTTIWAYVQNTLASLDSLHPCTCHIAIQGHIFIHVLYTHRTTLDFNSLHFTCLPIESRPAATLWEGASLPINITKHASIGLSHSDTHYLLSLFLINHVIICLLWYIHLKCLSRKK